MVHWNSSVCVVSHQPVDDVLDGVVPLFDQRVCLRLQQELVACHCPQLQHTHLQTALMCDELSPKRPSVLSKRLYSRPVSTKRSCVRLTLRFALNLPHFTVKLIFTASSSLLRVTVEWPGEKKLPTLTSPTEKMILCFTTHQLSPCPHYMSVKEQESLRILKWYLEIVWFWLLLLLFVSYLKDVLLAGQLVGPVELCSS